ncbi:hypothetical protein JW998_15910 [candidate division KSB1 bacterium]|nr:hypothetical protein [candidate division KSB1 bacterium]
MPPLRQRYGDIPLLISEFIRTLSDEYGTSVSKVSPDVLNVFQTYDWPGNIRELKNILNRAVLMCDSDTIKMEHLPQRFSKWSGVQPTISFKIGTSLEEIEHQMILRALEVTNNNRTAAAELIGTSRRAIYNKLKKHHIV